MIVALLSDLHANLEATRACLKHAEDRPVDFDAQRREAIRRQSGDSPAQTREIGWRRHVNDESRNVTVCDHQPSVPYFSCTSFAISV